MTRYIGVQGAYGRDYTSGKAVRADWDAGKDFQITDMGPDCGRYISKREVPAGTKVTVRFARQTKTVNVN